jgi:hypothetical protein
MKVWLAMGYGEWSMVNTNTYSSLPVWTTQMSGYNSCLIRAEKALGYTGIKDTINKDQLAINNG